MHAPRPDQSFPTTARLHRPAQFAVALKGRRIARGDWLLLTVPGKSPEADPQSHARLGMVIAKRYAKLAATRNAVKRVLREAFRHAQGSLPPRDYVFRLHSRIPSQSLTRLKQHVRSQAEVLLQQARQRT